MIRLHHEWVVGSFQVASPRLECVDDCEQLLLGRGVITLGLTEFSGLERDWTTILEKNSANPHNASIGHHLVRLGTVW